MMADSSSARNPIDTTLSRPAPTGFSRGTIFLPIGGELALHPEQAGDREAPDVGVEEADDEAALGQRHRQVDRDRGLAHPALARRHGQDPGGGGDVGRQRPVLLCLAPGPVHEGAALGGVHLPHDDLDRRRTPGRLPTRDSTSSLELGAQGAAGDGEGDLHLDPAVGVHAARARTMPRSTMLSPSSGSITPNNAARTVSSAGGEEGAGTPPILLFTWSGTVRTGRCDPAFGAGSVDGLG